MSKKLRGNGLFESSRMMLPEHKEAYNEHRKHLERQTRPQLDDEEAERIFRILAESMRLRAKAALLLFREEGPSAANGVVVNVDPLRRRIRLAQDGDFRWIDVADIIDAALD
jgi:hypothetical protein